VAIPQPSAYHVQKERMDAVLVLTSGATVIGQFFLAPANQNSTGRERVGELLNAELTFFPFENERGDTILYNRDHVVTVEVFDDEARRDAGYGVARPRTVTLSLANGKQLSGSVRVFRPEGHDRLSDWARHGPRFRYVETAHSTFLVNVDHVVDAREVE
jgi:hypothetical protein